MSRSRETYGKKEVRNRKEKKRKEKEQRRLARKESEGKGNPDDMIAYVDERGMITSEPPDPVQKKAIDPEEIQISTPKKEDLMDADPIRTGQVTYFNEDKGYGFIKDTESGESVFYHVNNLLEDVGQGDTVNFEVERGPKGFTAINVKLVKK